MQRNTWPVTAEDLGLCMLDLNRRGKGESIINTTYSGVLSFCNTFGGLDLGGSQVLKYVREHIGRTCVRPNKARDPLLLEDLKKVLGNVDCENLVHFRDGTLFVVGWHGFLRHGDIANLRVKDVIWEEKVVKLKLTASKTDTKHKG